jgi:pSer/pThr/pTyr-binding forkhead associated (FHA) protein
MKLSLVVLNAGKASGQVISIPIPQFVIGRDPECNLRPASALVSKKHCCLLTRSSGVIVRDYDSTNGTFVNDIPVKGEALLNNDDILKVGPLTFRVAIEGKLESKTPTPPAKRGDDDVAALLLEMDDAASTVGPASLSEVPDGSTVMDLPAQLPGATPTPPTGAPKKPEPKRADTAQDAAKAILAKFGKRGR